MTHAISAPSSPLRQRQSRSERQWSSRETITATRLRSLDSANRCSISNGSAISSRNLRLEGGAIGRRRRLERHPHEEAPLATRVLVGVDDVEIGIGEEAADGGDQAGPVGAGEEQPRCQMLVFDRRIIAQDPAEVPARQGSGLVQRSCVMPELVAFGAMNVRSVMALTLRRRGTQPRFPACLQNAHIQSLPSSRSSRSPPPPSAPAGRAARSSASASEPAIRPRSTRSTGR